MARFTGPNDITLFKHFSEELVEDIVTTTIQLFKLSTFESRTNLYGESLGEQISSRSGCNLSNERWRIRRTTKDSDSIEVNK